MAMCRLYLVQGAAVLPLGGLGPTRLVELNSQAGPDTLQAHTRAAASVPPWFLVRGNTVRLSYSNYEISPESECQILQ